MPQTAVATARPREVRAPNVDDRATALAALDSNGGNIRFTARQLGIPEATLRGWANRPDASGDSVLSRLRARKSRSLAEKFSKLAHKLVGVAYRKAPQLDAYRATIAGAAACDKTLLLNGQATVIHGQSDPRLTALSDERLAEYERMLACDTVDATPLSASSETVSDTTLSPGHTGTTTGDSAVPLTTTSAVAPAQPSAAQRSTPTPS